MTRTTTQTAPKSDAEAWGKLLKEGIHILLFGQALQFVFMIFIMFKVFHD